jgi:hypothetical protein
MPSDCPVAKRSGPSYNACIRSAESRPWFKIKESTLHTNQHPLSGKTVRLNQTARDLARDMVKADMEYRIEDWWDHLTGGSWMDAEGNPAAKQYAIRTGFSNQIPTDDDVVYGHINGIGHLVHVSELGEVIE